MFSKKILPIIFFFFCFSNNGTAQAEGLTSAPFIVKNGNLKSWFLKKDKNEKTIFTHQFRNQEKLEYIFTTFINNPKFYDWFNAIDFNHDGIEDMYYEGYSGAESTVILLFEGKGNEQFELVFEQFGRTIGSTLFGKFASFNLNIHHYPCCGAYENVISQYLIFSGKNKTKSVLHHQESFIDGTIEPTIFLEKEISFLVKNDNYKLRSKPVVDTQNIDWTNINASEGNTIAEYPKKSKGIALSEMTDATGRKWWFVKMTNNLTPNHTFFSTEDADDIPCATYGWMSSNFLEIIK